MRKIIYILIIVLIGLFIVFQYSPITLGAPVSSARIERNINPETDSTYYLGTTTPLTRAWAGIISDTFTAVDTNATSTFPNIEITGAINLLGTYLTDLTSFLFKSELDTFSELQTQIADKTLVNEEDTATFDSDITFGTSNPIRIDSDGYIDFTPISAPTYNQGLLFYNTSEKTLGFYNEESEIQLSIGQENWIRARNSTGSTITNGSVVYVSGATGNRVNISLANAEADAGGGDLVAVGIATHDIEDNSDGYITTHGIINDVDTSDWDSGDELFLSTTTPGTLTNVIPTPPDWVVPIGYVLVSNPSNGSILVDLHSWYETTDLTSASADETITGDWLFNGATTTVTNNLNISSLTASMPVFTDALKNLVSKLVDLATDITGTLPLGNGGTGSTSFTSGSIPFSNGTILTQDNSNLFWNDTDNRLGIGTDSPVSYLDIPETLTIRPSGSSISKIQTNNSNGRMDFITDRSGGTQKAFFFGDAAGNESMSITDSGNMALTGSLTVSSLGAGAVQSSSVGLFSSGTLPVASGGTGATSLTNLITLGTHTTGNYALGDSEGGAATTGDSATSFFSTGTLEDARLETTIDRTIFNASDYITALGGVHVGGTSDPGTDDLLVDGDTTTIGTASSTDLYISRGFTQCSGATTISLSGDDLTIDDDTCLVFVSAQTGGTDNLDTIIGGHDGQIIDLIATFGHTITVRNATAGSGAQILVNNGTANHSFNVADITGLRRVNGSWYVRYPNQLTI